MPKFAVYYVPEPEDEFYRLGSSLLGYDVRARQEVPLPSDLQAQFGQLQSAPEWTVHARPFGLHLTITDSLSCDWAALPKVERELEELLACFDPSHPFTLQCREDTPVASWGKPGKLSIVLLYEPNEYLRILHTLLVARINSFGTGSGYLQSYLAHPRKHEMPLHRAQQIRLFYSPTVLDNWTPHFTIFNPYTGDEPEQIASMLANIFEPFKRFTMRSICLFLLRDEQSSWQIYREFQLP